MNQAPDPKEVHAVMLGIELFRKPLGIVLLHVQFLFLSIGLPVLCLIQSLKPD